MDVKPLKIWLDDVRPAPEGWVWCVSVNEVYFYLIFADVEEMSLDHDLGENEPTGYDLVKHLAEFDLWPTRVRVHSMNPVGRANMVATINRYAPGVYRS